MEGDQLALELASKAGSTEKCGVRCLHPLPEFGNVLQMDSRPLGRCCGSRPQVATKYGALVESGLLHLFAKETGCKRSHRFESCTLRQICITETHKEGSHSGLVRQLGKLVDCKRSQGFKSPTLLQISERCERGLFSFFAKEVNVKAFRGFESHPFLHFLW